LRVFTIVLASPGDVATERKLINKIIEEENRNHWERHGVTLNLLRWEIETYPTFHPKGPQGHVDDKLRIADADILVGIFWRHLGTLIMNGEETGTEHEINTAIAAWEQNRRPDIMLYFKQEAYLCTKQEEALQWAGVLRYKDSLPSAGLWCHFYPEGDDTLETLFRRHLAIKIADMTNPKLIDVEPSVGFETDALLVLTNKTGRELRVFWSTYVKGELEDKKYIIKPNDSLPQPTKIGHVWVLFDHSGEKAVYKATMPYQKIIVDRLG
jgi:hypothetical protein